MIILSLKIYHSYVVAQNKQESVEKFEGALQIFLAHLFYEQFFSPTWCKKERDLTRNVSDKTYICNTKDEVLYNRLKPIMDLFTSGVM